MKQKVTRAVLGAALGTVLFALWRETWFLTDDAHISFRYARRLLAGEGLVWNLAPFAPVEGYSNFLWVLLLEAVWWLTGLAPPQSANALGLCSGWATLWVAWRFLEQREVPQSWTTARPFIALAALLWVATNCSFVTWLNSGLETGLYVFLVALWLTSTVRLGPEDDDARALVSAAAASLATLTRPDGMVLALATAVVLGWRAVHKQRATALWTLLLLLPVVGHFLFRYQAYGAWLPNTYYAKHLGPWPEAGVRYLGAYILEYGLFAFLAVVLLAGAKGVQYRQWPSFPGLVACSALLWQVGYLTLVVGGDHFEYRMLAPVAVPMALVAHNALSLLQVGPNVAVSALLLMTVLGLPLPWLEHAATSAGALAPGIPTPFNSYVAKVDALKAWLWERDLAVRRREHVAVFRAQDARFGPQVLFMPGAQEAPLVAAVNPPGVAGWNWPQVAIIDLSGLNDFVIARTPPPQTAKRRMAHDRQPPLGYVECFRPNLIEVAPGAWEFRPRPSRLEPQDVQACETRFLKVVTESRLKP